KWMRKLKREFPSVMFCTEVATTTHVRLCLEYGIDAFWIGARTTSNPFMMQEIADALQGIDVPILVKNPVSPDIDLWIGAIDRLYNAGLRRIAAVHRGFSSWKRGLYRNPPHWSLVMELRSRIPNLPMVGDPSHMAGRRDLIPSLCQQLVHLHYDGIMLEVHPTPDSALSDAAQQLTPQSFSKILEHICIREPQSDSEIILAPLREKIDGLDHSIIELIAERMSLSSEIAKLKALNDISVVQPERYKVLLQDRLQFAQSQGLPEPLVKAIFDLIHDESIVLQNRIVLGLKH
ncbi:MAG: bifunctional 3-deoxy-7-phosphoheptulonate synthase/chorismate mutase type II, partial [Porphyromonas sp.]|nr:bifunctional 3-deoxy-7-phosphoheptulonate synthase/chorismate mutase type II [Porphyromonas sp.]